MTAMVEAPNSERLLEAANTIGELARTTNSEGWGKRTEVLLHTQAVIFRFAGVNSEQIPGLEIQDEGVKGKSDNLEIEGPEELVDLAEKYGIPPSQVVNVFAEEEGVMYIQTPSKADLGIEEESETAIIQAVKNALEDLGDERRVQEDEEEEEEEEEEVDGEDVSEYNNEKMPGGQPGVSKEFEESAGFGERKNQVIDLYQSNVGEWLTGEDLAEFAPDLDPDDTRDRSIGSRALSNAIDLGWLNGDVEEERRKGPYLNRYRYAPNSGSDSEKEGDDQSPGGEDEIAESESESRQEADGEFPPVINRGTQEHEILSLLSQLVQNTGERQTTDELAESSRLDKPAISAALSVLRAKGLVKFEDDPEVKGYLWKPSKSGEAELNRVGGFQLNNSSAA